MSKFLDRLEKIRRAAPVPMGFGAAARAEKLPGMALVLLISGDPAAAIAAAGQVQPDAMLLSSISGPAASKVLAESLPPSVPWGSWVSSLAEAEAQEYRECGCDLLVFSLPDTAIAAVVSDELARIACVEPSIEERELRALEALPIDGLLLPMGAPTGPWTLRDLASIGAVSRRVSKYVLVQVSRPPTRKELEALRDIGVHGLLLDGSGVSLKALGELKTALLEMPRPKGPKGSRANAILPSAAFVAPQPPPPEPEQDE